MGICFAAVEVGLPCIIHFTLESGGKIAEGCSFRDATVAVDEALQKAGKPVPLFFGVDCEHPVQIELALQSLGAQGPRVSSIGFRSNCIVELE